MKLFYKRNSPFTRIAWVLAIEAGLEDDLELVEVTTRDPESLLLQFSPVGRVPTLQTDDGHILSEATVIAGYFDSLRDGPRIVPGFEPDDLPRLALQSLAMGLLEGVVYWARETWNDGESRSSRLIELETDRATRVLDALEGMADAGELDIPLTIGQITLATALGFCDAAHDVCDWRRNRPKLTAWYEAFIARPSLQKTMPIPLAQRADGARTWR